MFFVVDFGRVPSSGSDPNSYPAEGEEDDNPDGGSHHLQVKYRVTISKVYLGSMSTAVLIG